MEPLFEVSKLTLPRYIPLMRNVKIRWFIGSLLLVLVFICVSFISQKSVPWRDILLIAFIAWFPSILLTDKYVHKYPQRYTSYLIVSHFKAFCIMGFLLVLFDLTVGLKGFTTFELAMGFLFFCIIDAVVSYPHKKEEIDRRRARDILHTMGCATPPSSHIREIKTIEIRNDILKVLCQSSLDHKFSDFINRHLPQGSDGSNNVKIVEDIEPVKEKTASASILDALFCTTQMNDVNRLNLFLEQVANYLAQGGYFIMTYTPLENVYSAMRQKYSINGYRVLYMLHFLWFRAIRKIPFLDKVYFSNVLKWLDKVHLTLVKRRNRVLSKAEMWGRLAFWGMEVIAESQGNKSKCVVARKVADPHPNRSPSYYPVIALAKVGLDGNVLRMHKVRSMYAFSEYIQNRVFQDQGLTETGKFNNDFRLTEYGKFIRRYWIDELPQLYDWLRGDIKLVGMRATSPHYLTLYPPEVYDLYIQVKPGLISPIFDEATTDFKQIANIEYDYLNSYIENPVKADFKCFMRTFRDIFIRGVRSK